MDALVPTLAGIEEKTHDHAKALRNLLTAVAGAEADIAMAKAKHRERLLILAETATATRAGLAAAIEAAPELFMKPKTRTFYGVKVGYGKQKGKTVVKDEAKTIKRIRSLFSKKQADALINTTEKVVKAAIGRLTGAEIKKIGVRVEDDTDIVVIKPTGGDVDKLIAALLEEGDAS